MFVIVGRGTKINSTEVMATTREKPESHRASLPEALRKELDELGKSESFIISLSGGSLGTPIVYASEGFEELSEYKEDEVLGHSCAFMQGEETGREEVAAIREALREESSLAVCLKNYKKSEEGFNNLFFLLPVHDVNGNAPFLIGVQRRILELPTSEQEWLPGTTLSEDLECSRRTAHAVASLVAKHCLNTGDTPINNSRLCTRLQMGLAKVDRPFAILSPNKLTIEHVSPQLLRFLGTNDASPLVGRSAQDVLGLDRPSADAIVSAYNSEWHDLLRLTISPPSDRAHELACLGFVGDLRDADGRIAFLALSMCASDEQGEGDGMPCLLSLRSAIAQMKPMVRGLLTPKLVMDGHRRSVDLAREA